jgi:hypothetical protein
MPVRAGIFGEGIRWPAFPRGGRVRLPGEAAVAGVVEALWGLRSLIWRVVPAFPAKKTGFT